MFYILNNDICTAFHLELALHERLCIYFITFMAVEIYPYYISQDTI